MTFTINRVSPVKSVSRLACIIDTYCVGLHCEVRPKLYTYIISIIVIRERFKSTVQKMEKKGVLNSLTKFISNVTLKHSPKISVN